MGRLPRIFGQVVGHVQRGLAAELALPTCTPNQSGFLHGHIATSFNGICSSAAASADANNITKLTPDQRRQLDTLSYKLQRPATLLRKVAVLGAMAGTYRDVYVAMDSLYRREVMRLPSPLIGPHTKATSPATAPTPPVTNASTPTPSPTDAADSTAATHAATDAADAAAPTTSTHRTSSAPSATSDGPAFPLVDVSVLPDGPERGLQLNEHLMDTQAAWAQLQPGHVEMSHQLLTGMQLFPPTEATYPTYVDFGAAMRLLDHYKSRKRMRLLRRLLRKQDKYQIGAHGHYVGEA